MNVASAVSFVWDTKPDFPTRVRLRPLEPGNLVLRKMLGMAKNPAWGKLGSN